MCQCSGGGLGLGFGFLLGLRLSLGLRLFFGLLFSGLAGLVLEVGRVPAAAFELKAGGAEKLLERGLAADRAVRERRLARPLQKLLLVAAGLAAIFIDRHAAIISR